MLFYASNVNRLSVEVVKKFIDLGSNINDQDDGGRTIIHLVAKKSVVMGEDSARPEQEDVVAKLELINYLIEKGADVSLTDENGNDPLKLSLQSDQPEVIITRFIDIIGDCINVDRSKSSSQVLNQRNKLGFTCLYYIIHRKRYYKLEIIRKMIKLGADPNVTVCRNNVSAFEHALCRTIDIPILTALIPTSCELRANSDDAYYTVHPVSTALHRVIESDLSGIEAGMFEDFLEKLITAGCDVQSLLYSAIRCRSFRFELVKVLVRRNMPISVYDIIEAIRLRRYDVALLLLNTIHETDKGKVREIRTNYPGLACQVLTTTPSDPFEPTDVTIVDVLKVLLEKFEIDVNYSNGHDFILYWLLLMDKTRDSILDYLVTNHPHLDINKKVGSGKFVGSVMDFALLFRFFDFAIALIRHFASTVDLDLRPPSGVGFTQCYQLLYQLGVEIKFREKNSPGVQKEVDWFKEWIKKQEKTVKPLTKLCTLVIRRNVSSHKEIEEITGNYELPDKVVKMLTLDDEQESYIPPDHDSDDHL